MYILVWKGGQQIMTFQDLEECGQFQTASNIVDGQIFSIQVTPTMSKGGETGEVVLRRLMYLSKSTEPEECNAEYLADMAHVATLRNREIGVSGFLLYSAPFFFQVIEGTDEDLDFLFAKITADPRHERCIVLANGPCNGRMYGEWHMKDSHIDSITKHPAIKTILFQIARSFSSMWSYLPKNAANMLLLGKHPNKQAPEPMSVVVTFIYLVEFSSILAHPGLTEQCADVLAAFIDACVRNVEGTGGQVAKFITGICMAYWPINRAEDALVGLQQLSEDLAELRSQQPPGSALALIYSRCGVHYGRALLCNAGFRKADFTLLGDCINTASRITSLATKLRVPLLMSFEVRCLLGDEMREEIESAGLHKVKGRDKPVQVYLFSAPEVDSAVVRTKIEQFNPGRYRAQCPVKPYDSLHPSQRPPIFDDTPRDHQPSQHQRRDSLVDRLSLIAKLAFPPSMLNGGESQLITLTYISQAAHPMSRLDLSAIQRVAFRRNQSSAISGSLLYVSGLFVQTLEGPKGAVVALYLRIRQDKRHKDVVAVHMAPLDDRVYSSPLDMTSATEEMLASFPPLQYVLSQLAKSFISLETYVPSTVVRYLTAGNNPRSLQPVSVEVVMLATDICSFTPLSERCSLTEVWTICNTFIDACTSSICNGGGEVIKLIGDCVTAYFPPTAADNAVAASQEIVMFCAQLREAFADILDCRSVVACGVGLDFGQVIMAQCGSLGMTEFVVAGEVSARVMEVEALTREAGRAVVVTEPVADRLSPKLRDTGLVPLQEGVDGVPCYGILGPEWELDVVVIKKNIQRFHELRAHAAMRKVDDGTNAPGRAGNGAAVPQSPKARVQPGRTGSVASYSPDPNEVLDPRVAETVFQELCHQRGDIPNNTVLARLRGAAYDDKLDLARTLQGPHELPPLLQALRQLTNLRLLNISDNFVDDATIGDLVEACLPMRLLQVLDLTNNPGLTKVVALKRLVKHNPNVRDILLSGTRVAPTEQRKLQSSMNVNRLALATDSRAGHKYEGTSVSVH